MFNYINLSPFRIGQKQEAGIMSVYPLLAEDVSTPLAGFEDIRFLGTISYGLMNFKNTSEHPFIIPTGYSILTKQLAQDHALPFASLIKGNSTRVMNEACCIQETQGGYIDGSKVKEFSILPLFIRKEHLKHHIVSPKNNDEMKLKVQDIHSFSRLWTIISNFQSKLVQRGEGNLILFFNKFVDQLAKFNAEFETVEGQRGAIIMLNDKIVGIEVAPTQDYWNTVWNSLIRDCYGSEVIRLTLQNLVEEFETSKQLELNLENCQSIKEIKEAMDTYYDKDKERLTSKLSDLEKVETLEVNRTHSLIKNNSSGDIHYHLIKANDMDIYGEVYCDKDQMIYASVLF